MCIAVLTKPGAALTEHMLDHAWRINGDGAGMAYIHNGKVVVEKGFLTKEPFKQAYFRAVEKHGKDNPMLVHLRIGTSGQINAANTHPFEITPQRGPHGAFIHNGILFQPTGEAAGPEKDRRSDTRVVSHSLNNILVLEDIKRSKEGFGRAIGWGNKFAFLYDNGEYVIVNEDSGFWNKDKDIWFSNTGCGVSRGP